MKAKVTAKVYAAAQFTEPTFEPLDDDYEDPAPAAGPPEGQMLETLRGMSYTDLGNAKRLHRQFGRDMRWCAARKGWFLWTGTHWQWDDHEGALHRAQLTVEHISCEAKAWERAAKEQPKDSEMAKAYQKKAQDAWAWHHKSQGSDRISAILKQAKGLPGMAVSMEDFDRDPMLLNVQNGTIDLRTGVCRVHRRKDLIDRVAPVVYDANAKAETWEKFVGDVFPDAGVRSFVQRALGYSFTGDVSEQVWFLLKGKGSNGKSTILEVIAALLGPYATSLIAGFLEQKDHEPHPTELTGLHRARFASGTEPRKDKKWDAEKLKRLTGGDRIKARFTHKDEFEFDATHKLWVSCNALPESDDRGDGFWRRVVVIPFTRQWYRPEDPREPKIDPKLPEKLKKELSGILNWVIEGLKEWNRNRLQVPEACRLETKKYREEQDEIAKFLAERCMVGNSWSVTTHDLYQSYIEWRSEQEIEGDSFNKPKFGRALTDAGFISFEGKHKIATRRGLRLLTDEEQEARKPKQESPEPPEPGAFEDEDWAGVQ